MNQTIYFRKEVWKLLEKEDNRSALVNELLEEHYALTVKLCKHGNPKGQCMNKEAGRMKCNV